MPAVEKQGNHNHMEYINGFMAFIEDTQTVATINNGHIKYVSVSQAIADDYNIFIGKRKVIMIWLSHPQRLRFLTKEDAAEYFGV